jgi:hypothetical protein
MSQLAGKPVMPVVRYLRTLPSSAVVIIFLIGLISEQITALMYRRDA